MRILLVLGALIGGIGFLLGRITAPSPDPEPPAPVRVSPEANAACCAIVEQVQRDNYGLRQQLVYQEQSVVVERESCRALKDDLQSHVDEISSLEEQLAFYRGIVSPEEVQSGVQVFGLDLRPVADRVYQFQITLLQSVRRRREVRGTVALTLEGLRGDEAVTLADGQLAVGEPFVGEFAFRYYQELFGQLRVPPDVQPLRLIVALETRGRSAARLEQTYLWSELIAGSEDQRTQIQNGSSDE